MAIKTGWRASAPPSIRIDGVLYLSSGAAIEALRTARRDPELTYSWLHTLVRRRKLDAVNKYGRWYVSAKSIRDYAKRTRAWSRPPAYKSAHKR